MAVNMFLKLDGIAGESKDAKHKGEIDLVSFSWGETNTGGAARAGAARAAAPARSRSTTSASRRG